MILSQHYLLLKTLHIFGVIIFLGNIIVTAFWKTFADVSQDWNIITFSQRLVTYTDICFTAVGVLIITSTGLLLSQNHGEYWHVNWIVMGASFFIASAVIWIILLLPLQVKLHRIAKTFHITESIPRKYWIYETLWAIFGIIATGLSLVTLYYMVFKPL